MINKRNILIGIVIIVFGLVLYFKYDRKSQVLEGYDQLNKAFDSRVRMGVMSVLVVNSWVSYKDLKSLLGLTDGNLASHINALEKLHYIEIKKQFIVVQPFQLIHNT